MSLNQIKQLTSRIRTLARSDNVPRFEGREILIALSQLERLCEGPEPKLVENRADMLTIVDKVWPDCPPEVRNEIGGPINACDWAGETVETVTAVVKLAKKEYKKKPYTFGNNPPKLGKRRRLRRAHRQ